MSVTIEIRNITSWTIYFNPTDFPYVYVAYKFDLAHPTKLIIRSTSLDELRKLVQKNSDHMRIRICKTVFDHPSVIETWI